MAEPLTPKELAARVYRNCTGPIAVTRYACNVLEEEIAIAIQEAVDEAVARVRAEMRPTEPPRAPEPARGLAQADVKDLPPGLYRLEWVLGGSSLAFVEPEGFSFHYLQGDGTVSEGNLWHLVAAVYSLTIQDKEKVVPKRERCRANRLHWRCQKIANHDGMHEDGSCQWND